MDMFVRMEGNLNPYWHWGREVEDSVATAGKDGSAAEGWRTVMTLQITKLYTLKELKTCLDWLRSSDQSIHQSRVWFPSTMRKKKVCSTKNLSINSHSTSYNSKKKQSRCSDKQMYYYSCSRKYSAVKR